MIEKIVLWGSGLLLLGAFGFLVWLVAFDNGGCAKDQHLVQAGTTVMVINGKVTILPQYDCAEGSP